MSVPPDAALIRHSGSGRGGDAALELALAGALLQAAADGRRGPTIRFYRPSPAVAFGRQDRFASGFADAAAAAEQHGFTPVVRAPGGHAAAYDGGALVIDEVVGVADAIAGVHERFATNAERHAATLRELGIDARIGKVPGEYCPGDFTISAAGRTKLVGSAQRIVKGAWLFSTVIVVEGSERLRAVLTDVYAALGLDWDPATTGAVKDAAPGLEIGEVERALLGSYRETYRLVDGELTPEIVAAAEHAVGGYRISSNPEPGPTSSPSPSRA